MIVGTASDKPQYKQTLLLYHFAYILQCSNGAFYTGYATDVAKRIVVARGDDPLGKTLNLPPLLKSHS